MITRRSPKAFQVTLGHFGISTSPVFLPAIGIIDKTPERQYRIVKLGIVKQLAAVIIPDTGRVTVSGAYHRPRKYLQVSALVAGHTLCRTQMLYRDVAVRRVSPNGSVNNFMNGVNPAKRAVIFYNALPEQRAARTTVIVLAVIIF